MVKSSPGIIIVASSAANSSSLPLNSSRAKANAVRMVMTRDRSVDTSPTIMVFMNSRPSLAVVKAVR